MTSATRSSAVVRLGALADQLVSLDLDDADAREPSGRQAAIPQIDDAVDLGRLSGRPTGTVVRTVSTGIASRTAPTSPRARFAATARRMARSTPSSPCRTGMSR